MHLPGYLTSQKRKVCNCTFLGRKRSYPKFNADDESYGMNYCEKGFGLLILPGAVILLGKAVLLVLGSNQFLLITQPPASKVVKIGSKK